MLTRSSTRIKGVTPVTSFKPSSSPNAPSRNSSKFFGKNTSTKEKRRAKTYVYCLPKQYLWVYHCLYRGGWGIVVQGQCGTEIAFMTFYEQMLWTWTIIIPYEYAPVCYPLTQQLSFTYIKCCSCSISCSNMCQLKILDKPHKLSAVS